MPFSPEVLRGTLLNVLQRLLDHLSATGLVDQNDLILVGYSGGADSTCLLHLLNQGGFNVIGAHLHHGQRADGDKEMALCEAFCQELDIPFVSGRADVPKMSKELKIGIEEAGRMARYNFLEQAARRLECAKIATAHTQTENVETILFNLIRGSGPSGLAGIPATRRNIVRPLLPFSRSETRSYCQDHGLWFHDDPNNDELQFSRARLRHRIVPEIELINPAAESAIARAASIFAEEDQFLNGAAAAALERAEMPLNGDLGFLTKDVEMAFGRRELESLPPVLFKRAVRLAVEALGESLDYSQTQLIAEGFTNGTNGSVTAEGGKVVAEWSADKLHIRHLQPTEPFRFKLTKPGETESEEFGWKISAYDAPNSQVQNSRTALRVEVSRSEIRGDLYFRSAQAGDEMQPLGFEGTRKLSDLLSEAKLTPAARVRLPVICDFLGPIWAPGVCLSHRINKNFSDEHVLVLSFEPI